MAKEKKRRFRKLFVLAVIAGLIALAILYGVCGGGFGFGGGGSTGLGKGTGTASGTAPVSDAAPSPAPTSDATIARCDLRVDTSGIHVDGKAVDEAGAVAACKVAGAADVLVTGDAVQGTWDHLRAALDAAGVATYVRGAPSAVDAGV